MNAERYRARGAEGEFEPGSRQRVLRNRLGIKRVRDMEQAESDALECVQEWAVSHYDSGHRFGAGDLCDLHRNWLGGIYDWAGEYRTVNIAKGGFMFAVANRVPTLMAALEREELKSETPCFQMTPERLALALARTHGELILIHPFRDGNGRCARLLAYLMALQAGLPSLDFSPLAGRGKLAYVEAIHAAMSRDYAPLAACFSKVIRRTSISFGAPG